MQLMGQRLSEAGKLHLVKNNKQNQPTWFTVCGRNLRRDDALPTEQYDFGNDCCSCCSYKHKRPQSDFRLQLPVKVAS